MLALTPRILAAASHGFRVVPKVAPGSVPSRMAHTYNDSKQDHSSHTKKSYVRPLPVVFIGLVGIGGLHAYNVRKRTIRTIEDSGRTADPDMTVEGSWPIRIYAALPLREVSRAWGWLNSLTVPVSLRSTLYGAYSNAFGCNLDEMDAPNVEVFENLGTFFYRTLKEGARVVDTKAELVCPSDGKILCCGKIENNARQVPLVKGLTYSLDALLGKRANCVTEGSDTERLKLNPDASQAVKRGNSLHYCVIYLAPGDYHRFHSPADWTVNTRRHFAGELLSVSPWIVAQIRNLFIINERVSLSGQWKHGFFSMIPVGATNVGSIIINFDEQLQTNTPDIPSTTFPIGTYSEKSFTGKDKVVLRRGEEVGGFKLGSTIVLVFEAPENFEFAYQDGDIVKMGTRLGK
ncbi:UNVERIFIED_CONTAM: phosphatidylserine decarboxylase 1 [Siphonaria sp. JEL0065]|nr:phosphatidylserine decarboxylase 1 [Siphonaria sp. JEL0065]